MSPTRARACPPRWWPLALLLALPGQALAGGHGFTFKDHGFFIIDFVVLIALIVWLTRKKFKAFLVARSTGIRQDMDDAKQTFDAARAEHDEKAARTTALAAERDEMLARFRDEAQQEKARIIAEAEARAEQIVAEARRQVEMEARKLQEGLTARAVEGAVEGARTHLREKMGEIERRRWTDDAIARLDKLDWRMSDAR
jgi:F-type H+-transporting ATPase subunit b